MHYFRRIISFIILAVFTLVLIAFLAQWNRVGKIIETTDILPQERLFSKDKLSASEELISKVAYGSLENKNNLICPSFIRVVKRRASNIGPTTHLAQIIMSDIKSDRLIQYQFDRLFLACRLESNHANDFLIKYTLSKVYLGNGDYGVENASLSLFQKSVVELSNVEAFGIAALIQSPSYRNSPDKWEARRMTLMKKHN